MPRQFFLVLCVLGTMGLATALSLSVQTVALAQPGRPTLTPETRPTLTPEPPSPTPKRDRKKEATATPTDMPLPTATPTDTPLPITTETVSLTPTTIETPTATTTNVAPRILPATSGEIVVLDIWRFLGTIFICVGAFTLLVLSQGKEQR